MDAHLILRDKKILIRAFAPLKIAHIEKIALWLISNTIANYYKETKSQLG